jgi:dual specificity protein kinase YAK1
MMNYSCLSSDRSKIPIRPDSSISISDAISEANFEYRRRSISKSNKRASLAFGAYPVQNTAHSRIPVAASSNNIHALTSNENATNVETPTRVRSSKRYSMIESNSYKSKSTGTRNGDSSRKADLAHQRGVNTSTSTSTSTNMNMNNISRISELSISESKIPRSPSLSSVSNRKRHSIITTPITEVANIPAEPHSSRLSSMRTNKQHYENGLTVKPMSRLESKQDTRNRNTTAHYSTHPSVSSINSRRSSIMQPKTNETTNPASSKVNNSLKFRSSFINHATVTSTSTATATTTPTLSPASAAKEKISSMSELMGILSTHTSTRSKLQNYTVDYNSGIQKRDPYKYEELSSKRPDLFEKLTMFERIAQYPRIYFTGSDKEKKIKGDMRNLRNNYGFDDHKFNYRLVRGDHISYKYEICSILGKGAFGSVVSVIDHSYADEQGAIVRFACKIISNDPKWLLQSVEEVKILRNLQHRNILKYHEHFNFRSHMCIVTELLGVSLYEAIQVNQYRGFSLYIVRNIIKEVLEGLCYLHSENVIHCDLKPENIMLTREGGVKIIDFGSSCRKGQLKYSYLQSRFYRSPEVLLGCRYDDKIDIWSVALIALELYCGVPLFQPQNEWELFHSCISYINVPSRQYILRSRSELQDAGFIGDANSTTGMTRTNTLLWKAFDKNGGINYEYVNRKLGTGTNINNTKFHPGSQDIKTHVRKHAGSTDPASAQRTFTEFVYMCLVWNRWARADAHECLCSEFFTAVAVAVRPAASPVQ